MPRSLEHRLPAAERPCSRHGSERAATLVSKRVREAAALAKEAALETVWPTRCCLCDTPGSVLCDSCRRNLSYLDFWRACPLCGAPYGMVQCSECNPQTLSSLGRSRYPFDSCTSSVFLDDDARRLVLLWKDGNELRLSEEMAQLIVDALPPSWRSDAPRRTVTPAGTKAAHAGRRAACPSRTLDATPPQAVCYVPASATARARRGFDHARLLAEAVARLMDLPSGTPFLRPRARDQRSLSRRERAANTSGMLSVDHAALERLRPQPPSASPAPYGVPPAGHGTAAERSRPPETALACILVVDDVFTTGSTLSAAADALKEHGIATVHCATFARAF